MNLDRETFCGHVATMLIYKIFRSSEWAEFQAAGKTRGAPIDLADGFIHFSTGPQVAATAQKYFANVQGLVLLALDPGGFGDDLKWEPARGGALFPHLYRALRIDDVTWHTDLPLGDDGHIFPKDVL